MAGIFDSDILTQISQRQKQNSDLLLKILNFSDLTFEIEQSLKNYSFSPQDGKWVERGKPLINELGISNIRAIITSHLSNVNIVSNYTDEEVNSVCLMLGEDLIDELAQSFEVWEIDRKDLSIIVTIVMNSVYAMLKGSFDEGIRSLLRDVEKRETVIRQGENEKKGFLPSLTGG